MRHLMQPSDKARLIAFYEGDLARYGPQDPRSLHWNSARTQHARFQVLYQVGRWDGVSIADIGCGLGDFCGFLLERGHQVAPGPATLPDPGGGSAGSVSYVGYDIAPGMVAAARLKYPQARFQVQDILEEGLEVAYDYVVASGTFNIRIEDGDHERFFEAMIEAMYRSCRRAVAFNFLGPATYSPWSNGLYYDADPQAVLAYCRALCDATALRDGYLAGDYTVYMYKEPSAAGRRPRKA